MTGKLQSLLFAEVYDFLVIWQQGIDKITMAIYSISGENDRPDERENPGPKTKKTALKC